MDVGRGTLISWCCEFLDDDWHACEYEGRQTRASGITIGRDVWIGCHVLVLKGWRIPDGCVMAARSVVMGTFTERNALIAGNPARIERRNIK